jgi:DUF4097 and DUF4098 domain-containing protein YvlB
MPVSHEYSAEESFSFEFDFTGQSLLKLESISGKIKVAQSPDFKKIKVYGKKIAKSYSLSDAKAQLNYVQVFTYENSNEVLIKSQQPRSNDGRDYGVEYFVTLPQNFDVHIKTVNSKVQLEEIYGNVRVNSTNGSITGDVNLPLAGYADLKLVNGSINLQIPRDVSAKIYASLTIGDISVNGLSLSNEKITSTSYYGESGNAESIVNLKTDNGNIALEGF